jgi:hypothetical protein
MIRRVPRSQRQPRSLAGLLCRLHYPAVWPFRRSLRLRQSRSEEAGAGVRVDRLRVQRPGHLFPMRLAASSGAKLRARRSFRWPMNIVMGEDVLSPAKVKDDLDHLAANSSRPSPNRWPRTLSPSRWAATGWSSACAKPAFSPPAPPRPSPETLATLRQIAASLGRTPYDLRIEGHTDNIPIHTTEFDSNWELSTARATSIARTQLARPGLKAIPADSLVRRRLRRVPSRRRATIPPKAARKTAASIWW